MIEKLINLGLTHKLLAILITIAVCTLGVLSITNLPMDAFPDISPNMVQVFAEVDGMAPEEVEQLVTRPTETAMRSIPGLKKIRSLSSLGLSTVNLYFEDEVDIYRARQLVSERMKFAEEGIPEDIDMPHGLEMGPVASGMGKILSYYLQSDSIETTELRRLHDFIVKRGIETVSGVAKVISQGGHVRQFEVELSPEKLQAHTMSIADVCDAIEKNNANVGAGIITRGSEELIVRTIGRVGSIEEIANTVVRSTNGKPILVSDLGTVAIGKAFRRGLAILNGDKEVVVGGVYKLHKANSFEVISSIQDRIDELNRTLPEGVQIVPFYDQSELVSNSIRTVRNALLQGLLLIIVVAFLFLGNLRNALIMVCSLPFALLLGIAAMDQAGIPGDLISFGGMAIALGMIIDATIIMVEKLQTAVLDPGDEAKSVRAIRKAAEEVGRPIVFAIAVISIVFLPIFTLGEVEGKMFRPLAFAVVATMVGSLLYALLVAPIFFRIIHLWDHKHINKKHGKVLSFLLDVYEKLVRKTIQYSYLLFVVILLLLIVGSLGFLNLGREFVPTLQEGTINCYAYMNPNVALDEIKALCSDIAIIAGKVPEVENVIVDIGYGEVGPHMHHTNYGCITITLKDRESMENARSQEEVVGVLEERLQGFLGVAIGFSQPIAHEVDGLISGAGAQVVMKVFGASMIRLKSIASELKQIIAEVDGVADLRVEQTDGQTQIQVILDAKKLARYSLNKHEVQAFVNQALTGQVVGNIFEGETTSRIIVQLDKRYQQDREALGNLAIPTPSGSYVPLGLLGEIKTLTGLRQISRENTQRYISVQCNVRGRDVGGFVREAQQAIEKANRLPAGYRIDWGGQFELQEAANKRLLVVIPITLIFVLFMLYSLFDSVKLTLLVMLNVPLALVGGVLALGAYGENLSIPSSIGFIALFGIALTDGIVLISGFERLRNSGNSLIEAVVSGCRSKFRPVLMTTITTALGLFPLIIATGPGSEVQRPLAIVVVFGLATSTFITLFAIPAAYMKINK